MKVKVGIPVVGSTDAREFIDMDAYIDMTADEKYEQEDWKYRVGDACTPDMVTIVSETFSDAEVGAYLDSADCAFVEDPKIEGPRFMSDVLIGTEIIVNLKVISEVRCSCNGSLADDRSAWGNYLRQNKIHNVEVKKEESGPDNRKIFVGRAVFGKHTLITREYRTHADVDKEIAHLAMHHVLGTVPALDDFVSRVFRNLTYVRGDTVEWYSYPGCYMMRVKRQGSVKDFMYPASRIEKAQYELKHRYNAYYCGYELLPDRKSIIEVLKKNFEFEGEDQLIGYKRDRSMGCVLRKEDTDAVRILKMVRAITNFSNPYVATMKNLIAAGIHIDRRVKQKNEVVGVDIRLWMNTYHDMVYLGQLDKPSLGDVRDVLKQTVGKRHADRMTSPEALVGLKKWSASIAPDVPNQWIVVTGGFAQGVSVEDEPADIKALSVITMPVDSAAQKLLSRTQCMMTGDSLVPVASADAVSSDKIHKKILEVLQTGPKSESDLLSLVCSPLRIKRGIMMQILSRRTAQLWEWHLVNGERVYSIVGVSPSVPIGPPVSMLMTIPVVAMDMLNSIQRLAPGDRAKVQMIKHSLDNAKSSFDVNPYAFFPNPSSKALSNMAEICERYEDKSYPCVSMRVRAEKGGHEMGLRTYIAKGEIVFSFSPASYDYIVTAYVKDMFIMFEMIRIDAIPTTQYMRESLMRKVDPKEFRWYANAWAYSLGAQSARV